MKTCERCGAFVSSEQRVCDTCLSRQPKPARLWSTTLLISCGAAFPFVPWALAMVNWWRLEKYGRMLLPVVAGLTRVVAIVFVQVLFGRSLNPWVAGFLSLSLNVVSMVVATIGLPTEVKAQRAAGVPSANRGLAIAGSLLPVFCFVGLYQVFSQPR